MCSKCFMHPTTRILVGCGVMMGTILAYFYLLNVTLNYLPQVKDYNFGDVMLIFAFVVFPMLFVYLFYRACKLWNHCAEDDAQYLPLPVYTPYNAQSDIRLT